MNSDVICPYCKGPAVLTTGEETYPRHTTLHGNHFWICRPCAAFVGCHKPNPKRGLKGTEPLGCLANKNLRGLRSSCHERFDPLWKIGGWERSHLYGALAEKMGIPKEQCHFAMFDEMQCSQALGILKSMGRPPL